MLFIINSPIYASQSTSSYTFPFSPWSCSYLHSYTASASLPALLSPCPIPVLLLTPSLPLSSPIYVSIYLFIYLSIYLPSAHTCTHTHLRAHSAVPESSQVGVGPGGAAPGLHRTQVLRHIHLLQLVVHKVADVPRQVVVSGGEGRRRRQREGGRKHEELVVTGGKGEVLVAVWGRERRL